ncbi:MAG: haloacid dehalogenase type II [Bizionia sp.]|nr:haloacid dehalogenase type II [Bizionia sp.]
MRYTLAFDVYGTLINTEAVLTSIEKLVGNVIAAPFMDTWRDKQLEYSFRRGLMDAYTDFSVCTSNALDYACIKFNTNLSPDQREMLLNEYKTLPAFSDVTKGLEALKSAGHRLFAFSNGSKASVTTLLTTANILHYFEDVVSVEHVKMFKPSPIVYNYLLKTTTSEKSKTYLISSNNFDVIGATVFGMHSVWVKRSKEAIFDPWGVEPTIVIPKITDLAKKL